jgi:neutral ceramidase
VEEGGADPYDAAPYVDFLAEQAAGAVRDAVDALEPVTLRHGVTQQDGLSFNRRFYMQDGGVRFNPGKQNPRIVRPAGPVDTDVPMVQVARAGTNEPLAVLYTFGLHLDTVGGTEFGADYPHYVRTILRGAVDEHLAAVFGLGPCGDVNHVDVSHRAAQKGHGEAERIGRTLASAIQNALPALAETESPALAVRQRVIEAKAHTYDAEELAWARETLARVEDRDVPFLDKVRARAVVDIEARYGDTVPLEVQVMRLSQDVALVFFPAKSLPSWVCT